MKKFIAAFRADLAVSSPEVAFKFGMRLGATVAIWSILLLSVPVAMLGYKSGQLWGQQVDSPSTRPIAEGKYKVLGLVKGYDVNTGQPLYWATVSPFRTEMVNGREIEVSSTKVELLTVPRAMIVNLPDDGRPDPRLLAGEVRLEVYNARGVMSFSPYGAHTYFKPL